MIYKDDPSKASSFMSWVSNSRKIWFISFQFKFKLIDLASKFKPMLCEYHKWHQIITSYQGGSLIS